ncbi:hypothetical protein [Desulfotignum phosphitoxidans]|uniref:Uncharacterized protein n=1 Tax=Desulfotignum phosphitoxidans DSM 13687 TaxID=1286635 RepID=S0G160_9BACT|nr:hypothetical protein [Desulfotignum phosphitoxidans]EMS79169.1 hypothetical protein Dpo_5c00920 [Desulfotignum phosphitoxidans DSM 13687]
MNSIENIIKIFSEEYTNNTFEEDHNSLYFDSNIQNLKIPFEKDLTNALSTITDRDKLRLMVVIDHGDPVTLLSQKDPNQIASFLKELGDSKKFIEENSTLNIKIEISKTAVNNTLTIYSLEKITEKWLSYKIKSFWHCFAEILQNQYINFEVVEDIKPFYSENIYFFNKGFQQAECVKKEGAGEKRNRLINKLAENCHFANSSDCKLIPEDFFLLAQSEDERLNELFSRHTLLLSIIYLFDITSRDEDNELYYKLRGYRQISGVINFSDLKEEETKQYFDIYEWTYNEGNLSDKIGLARNIITIHIKENNPFLLAEDVLSSIKSGYDIYLKQNISQYIATKKQVVENIHKMNQRANQIADTIALPFRNCLLAIVTFFASLFIIRVSVTQRFDYVLTIEIATLSVFFIIISLSYMIMLWLEIKTDKERFKTNYQNLKERYEDILDKLDIEKIFNHDREHKADLLYINKKRCKYTWMWIITHLLLISIVLGLTYYGHRNMAAKQLKSYHSDTESVILGSQSANSPDKTKNERPDRKKDSAKH